MKRHPLLLYAILFFSFGIGAEAQSPGDLDSVVSPALIGGNPRSSYTQSSVDNVNLYNGNLNVAIPLAAPGGRGSASYTMVVPIQRRWSVDRNSSGPYPYSWNDAFSQLDYGALHIHQAVW